MPLQNRVFPDGDIIATPARGLMMGNRGGRLHDGSQKLGRRRWTSMAWICCRTQFNGRSRPVMGPGYTELFFLDEVTALAAGHRPCFECRRHDAMRFAELWNAVRGQSGRARAAEMDITLHAERLRSDGVKRTVAAPIDTLPDWTMIRLGQSVGAKHGTAVLPWTPSGYLARRPALRVMVEVLTPPSIVAVLREGYRPVTHGTASEEEATI